eukprot:scaffold80123_cov92-Cyclotella_meneghiniana.AAC.1
MKSKQELIANVEHKDKSKSYILVGKRRMSGEFCTDHDVPFCVECLTDLTAFIRRTSQGIYRIRQDFKDVESA